jgi:hypothetical protein
MHIPHVILCMDRMSRLMFWSLFHREEVRAEVARALRDHGDAAEAYLNYPLQDSATPPRQRRLARAALGRIRALSARERSDFARRHVPDMH